MTKAAELAKMGEVITNSQLGGRRNIVINGAMDVAQRSTSVTDIGATTGYFTCDRWQMAENDASAGRFTMSQTADGPNGVSANCLKLDCTTADTSIAAAEYLFLANNFEGQDLQGISKGLTGAKEVTVSFYVKANAAFNFVVEFQDRDNSRTNGRIFATTTDWVRHEITFQADVDDGSSPFDDDNAASARVNFWLHAGATYTGGTLASSWENITQANRAAGIDSFFSSTDNNFFLTGVQVEVGSQATPFEQRSFGEELALCKRYYNKQLVASSNFTMGGLVDGSRYSANVFEFSPPLRAAPTAIETSGTASDYAMRQTTTQALDAVPTFSTGDVNSTCFNMDKNGHGLTSGTKVFLRSQDADCFLAWSAEL